MNDILRRATLLLVVYLSMTPVAASGQWELAWSDEFDGNAVDPAKWSFQTGTGAPNCGWGNLELQFYREENATVADGKLAITAKEDSSPGDICAAGYDYTSARLRTIAKGDWLYGRFEIRAKMPTGLGLWPAIWMLPTGSAYGDWAASGEIDIMEFRWQESDQILGTIYYGDTFPNVSTVSGSYTLPTGTFADDFHTFALEWDPWELRWYVDDVLFETQTSWFSVNGRYPAPFDQEFHLLLNLAVGGKFPGPPDASTVFPQSMEVDFVRVYRFVEGLPEVTLEEPIAGANFDAGSTLDLSAAASDSDGQVTKVEFLQDDGVLASRTTAPYTGSVNDLYPGCYRVAARATDDLGYQVVTDPVDVTVGGACTEQAPYLMAATPIPGIVEAEYFDLGGPGVAYNDTDAGNVVGTFRAAEDVDLSHAGADVGFGVFRIVRGEWLEYTVDVKEAGRYQVTSRIASVANTGFRLEFDGIDKTGRIDVAPTGGELSWTNLITPDVELEAGVHVMRFVPTGSGLSLSRMTFARTGSISTEDVPAPGSDIVVNAYPHPFRETTAIHFDLRLPSDVEISVVDVLGRTIKVLASGMHPAGRHAVQLQGSHIPAGAYIVRVATKDQQVTRLITRVP